jgi:plastocyanin
VVVSNARALRAPAAIPAVLAGLLLATLAAWMTAGTARAAQTYAVDIPGLAFSPEALTVTVGDTVTWTNSDSADHTATADDGSFDSGSLANGESFSHTFSAAGTFPYSCTLHSGMTGTITVQAAAAAPGPSQGTSPDTALSATTGSPAAPVALVGMALLLAGLALLAGRRGAQPQLNER